MLNKIQAGKIKNNQELKEDHESLKLDTFRLEKDPKW